MRYLESPYITPYVSYINYIAVTQLPAYMLSIQITAVGNIVVKIAITL